MGRSFVSTGSARLLAWTAVSTGAPRRASNASSTFTSRSPPWTTRRRPGKRKPPALELKNVPLSEMLSPRIRARSVHVHNRRQRLHRGNGVADPVAWRARVSRRPLGPRPARGQRTGGVGRRHDDDAGMSCAGSATTASRRRVVAAFAAEAAIGSAIAVRGVAPSSAANAAPATATATTVSAITLAARRGAAAPRSRREEQPARAREQRAVRGSEREQVARLLELFETEQRMDVRLPAAADADREVVAAVFARVADLPRHPPHRRVIEEQRLDDGLREVHEVVVPPHVRELVRDDRFELRHAQAGEDGRRHDNDRRHVAEDDRHAYADRREDGHRSRDAQPFRQCREPGLTPVRHRPDAVDAQSPRPPPAADEPDREEQDPTAQVTTSHGIAAATIGRSAGMAAAAASSVDAKRPRVPPGRACRSRFGWRSWFGYRRLGQRRSGSARAPSLDRVT